MSDEYLSEWKPWKVTASELEKLRAKDRTALEAFYFSNLDIIERFAKRYYFSLTYRRQFYTVEDMLQNVFLCLDELEFELPSHFQVVFRDVLTVSCFGINFANARRSGYRNLFFSTETILDTPLTSDCSRNLVDCIPGGINPHNALMEYYKLQREDKFDRDLDLLLRKIFTPVQYEHWKNGVTSGKVGEVIRRNASEIIQFLREHGVCDPRLKGQILTNKDYADRSAERKALLSWQEEHFDELEPAEQKKVLERQRLRALRARQKAEKARASV